jgi:Flp pilus assembly CpaF family ATPase
MTKKEIDFMADNSINIEKIMEEIRADIKAKGYTDDLLNFDDVSDIPSQTININMSGISSDAAYIHDHWNIDINIPLDNKSIIKRLIKRIIRKFSLFVVFPIVGRQSRFNASVSKIVTDIIPKMETCAKLVEEMKAEQTLLKNKLEQMSLILDSSKDK